jgi:predicted dehydrogenase
MIEIGIVGGGHIATHRHIPIFKKIKDCEVIGVCDAVENVAKSVAGRFGIKHYYTRLSDMLRAHPDVVDITTPPQTHYSLALEAMEGGCHLLVEKPLAMAYKEVDEMFRVSKSQEVKLCVVHQNLFNPAVQQAVRLVKDGSVGDVISIDAGTLVRRDNYMCVNGKHWCHNLPGGIFFEVLPHPVYLLQIFLKEIEPTCVLTKKLSGFDWMRADELRVLCDSKNGIGSVLSSCNSPFHGDTLNVTGTKMSLQADLWGRTVIKYKTRTQDPVSVGKSNLSLASQFLGVLGTTVSNSVTATFGGEKVSAHYGFLYEFVKAIRTGSKLPASEDEAKENVKIVDKICSMIDASVS